MSIVFDNVCFSYGEKAASPALKNVSLTIEAGTFTGLIGHTGSGKSTLVEHMNGLKVPTSGKVLVNGHDTSDKKGRKAARGIVGFVSQYPEHQLFAETVFEDIAFGPRNLGFDEDEVVQAVNESLACLGIDPRDVCDKSPFELSGGQQRRVAIAGILAMKPEVLVLDEPLAGLDPAGRHEIMNIITTLHRSGKTIVMVSHSMDDIAEVADSLVVMNNGEIYLTGTPAQIFSDQTRLTDVGLDVPEATKYYRELTERGWELGPLIYTMDALVDAIARVKGADGGEAHGL